MTYISLRLLSNPLHSTALLYNLCFAYCIKVDHNKRTLKTHHHIFALSLQTVYVIEKLLAGFNVQLRIGMNQSLIWLHYHAADNVTWEHTASSTFLNIK